MHDDPMLGKVIVWDQDRAQATRRMHRALDELSIEGVATTRAFLARVLESPEWQTGRIHTRLLEEELLPRLKGPSPASHAQGDRK
jgi:acetyl-CoA carboxylase biotin carboxylase subunit